MNKHKSKASTAFSLIELSIVILIIGIIIAGITQSSRLVRQSKLKTAQQATQSSPVASIQGLAVWFEPTQDSSFPTSLDDEAFITQWNDTNPHVQAKLFALPASGFTTSGSASIKYDTDGINDLPSIIFDGTPSNAGMLLVSSSSGGLVPTRVNGGTDEAFTAFMVYKLDNLEYSLTNARAVLYNGSFAGPANGWGYHKSVLANSSNRILGLNGTVTSFGATQFQVSPEIATITYQGSSSATKLARLYLNGGTGYTTPSITSGITTILTPAPQMFIGATASSGTMNTWKGYISEIIIFDSMLKTQDLKDVGNYLSKKYNIRVT